MATCITCNKTTKTPTTDQIACNWRLFCEYVNPDGAMSYDEWETLTREELVALVQDLWPECDDRCECDA